jgi:hypothetical protein
MKFRKKKIVFDKELFTQTVWEIKYTKKVRSWWFVHSKNGTRLLFKVPFRFYFKWVRLPLILDFVRWVLYDWIMETNKGRLFGIFMFCGLFGEGKTLSMVRFAEEKRKQDPSIKIYSNFGYKFQEGEVNSIQDILDIESEKTIVMIDEIQNTFSNARWQDFPLTLLSMITQCRKKQLMLLCTAQIYRRVTPQIRELVQYVVQCSNVCSLNRLFTNKFFNSETYEQYLNAVGTENKKKIQPTMRRFFVADSFTFDLYDTKEVVENLSDTFNVTMSEKEYKDYKSYKEKFYKTVYKIPNFETSCYANFKYTQKKKEA